MGVGVGFKILFWNTDRAKEGPLERGNGIGYAGSRSLEIDHLDHQVFVRH